MNEENYHHHYMGLEFLVIQKKMLWFYAWHNHHHQQQHNAHDPIHLAEKKTKFGLMNRKFISFIESKFYYIHLGFVDDLILSFFFVAVFVVVVVNFCSDEFQIANLFCQFFFTSDQNPFIYLVCLLYEIYGQKGEKIQIWNSNFFSRKIIFQCFK